MPNIKLPDFNKLVEKIDLQSIVSNVKSIVSPGPEIPTPVEGDAVAKDLVEVIKQVHALADVHAQQAKNIAEINNKLNELCKSLQALYAQEHPEAVETAPKSKSKSTRATTEETSSKEKPSEESSSKPKEKTDE